MNTMDLDKSLDTEVQPKKDRVRPQIRPRRSERPTKKPKYLEDYICNKLVTDNRPLDTGLYALTKVLDARVMSLITLVVANRIIEEIMK